MLLAIESSCDDSCISIIDENYKIIFEKNKDQIDVHKKYGGVVPELASRYHLEYLQMILNEIKDTIDINKIECFAATCEPGMIGGLLVGTMMAKSLSRYYNKPYIGINHLEGHMESVNILREKHVEYPFVALLASGGHCQFMLAKSFGQYEILGKTLDDSIGEAFDKTAKMLNIEYPGGPKIEKFAQSCNNYTHLKIGKPMKDNGLNFSFSGFKTSVNRFIQNNPDIIKNNFNNVCFNIQKELMDNLVFKIKLVMTDIKKKIPEINNFIFCGGVAANKYIISNIDNLCKERNFNLHTPNIKYATDNSTMIAFSAMKHWKKIKN